MSPWDGKRARDFFELGQIVRLSDAGALRLYRSSGAYKFKAVVVGFGIKNSWCVHVIKEGNQATSRSSYSGDFLEPTGEMLFNKNFLRLR